MSNPVESSIVTRGGSQVEGRGVTPPRQRWRLLLVSSRARHVGPIAESLIPGVLMVTYKFETSTLDDVLRQVSTALGGRRVETIAVVFHGTDQELRLCGPGEKVLNTHSAAEQMSVREFFASLVGEYVDRSLLNARLDFLAAHPSREEAGNIIANTLHQLLSVPVTLSNDLKGLKIEMSRWGSDENVQLNVGELYFNLNRLKTKLKTAGHSTKMTAKDLDKHYEKIRTVGKGAFGAAVLYRRKEDEALVIIKEINMLELSASERQMALNEVNVLAMLDHPNIVSYMNSFELEGVLCIEMEYADGGSLAEFLQKRVKRLDEREVLIFFHQICQAIRHMHEHHILHRDLKTANIFLTKSGMVKVGDFGISKMMSTHSVHAHTVLGTPYYISPEMCQGNQYDDKSDIWALGCILYEMACLQKTFEGSNLPALVNKIMKGQFAPIKGNYSPGFKQLVRDLLQRDPDFRPASAEICMERLPELLSQFSYDSFGAEEIDQEIRNSLEQARQTNPTRSSRAPRSVVYHMKVYDSSISLNPVPLPPRTRVKEMVVSNTHIVLLTSECLVYTWGEGQKGQLGHETLEPWRAKPTVVEALKGKSITRVCAGDGFSIFASDNGIVMTCGDGTFGCLGHGDWNSCTKPKLIDRLLSVDVSEISCGSHHVVVVSGDGDVYTWGRGDGGRLGLGHEEDCCVPTEVAVPDDVFITNVKCGGDGTILITDQGVMLACGHNTRNKLGLSEGGGLFSMKLKKEVEQALIPTRIRTVGCRVVDVAMGPTHTAVLTETGQVITFGRNCEGQLGRGNTRTQAQPVLVRALSDRVVTMIQCGSTFTVVGTLENALYLWGTRSVSPLSRPNTQDGFTLSWNKHSASGSTSDRRTNPDMLFQETDHALQRRSSSGSILSAQFDSLPQREIKMRDVILQPQEILALYASPSQIAKGETVSLSTLHCQNQSIFLVVETTVPLPRPDKNTKSKEENSSMIKGEVVEMKDAQNHDGDNVKINNKPLLLERDNTDTNDMDNTGPVPDWLKAELVEAEALWAEGQHQHMQQEQQQQQHRSMSPIGNRSPRPTRIGHKPYSKKKHRDNIDNINAHPDSGGENGAISPFVPIEVHDPGAEEARRKIKEDRKMKAEIQKVRRLKRELKSKEDEIRQEVSHKAKEKEEALNDEIEKLRQELLKQQELQKQLLDEKIKGDNAAEKDSTHDSMVCLIM
ncbi:unnamed protein product, partial [Meganyctiphanes norvegica]